MREVVTPARTAADQTRDRVNRLAIEEAQDKLAAKRLAIARGLDEAFTPLSEGERREIRLRVALQLPTAGPLNREQQQDWLDEMCIGVARFMTTGKIA